MDMALEESKLDPSELELAATLLEFEGGENRNRLQNPLYIALGISPLCLLMPVQLFKVRMGRKNLLDVSWHFLCLE
jgi:hypothetical protein